MTEASGGPSSGLARIVYESPAVLAALFTQPPPLGPPGAIKIGPPASERAAEKTDEISKTIAINDRYYTLYFNTSSIISICRHLLISQSSARTPE